MKFLTTEERTELLNDLQKIVANLASAGEYVAEIEISNNRRAISMCKKILLKSTNELEGFRKKIDLVRKEIDLS